MAKDRIRRTVALPAANGDDLAVLRQRSDIGSDVEAISFGLAVAVSWTRVFGTQLVGERELEHLKRCQKLHDYLLSAQKKGAEIMVKYGEPAKQGGLNGLAAGTETLCLGDTLQALQDMGGTILVKKPNDAAPTQVKVFY